MKKQDPMDSCIIFLLTFDISDIKDFHKKFNTYTGSCNATNDFFNKVRITEKQKI